MPDWTKPKQLGGVRAVTRSVKEVIRPTVFLPTRAPVPYTDTVKRPEQIFRPPTVLRSVVTRSQVTDSRNTLTNKGKTNLDVLRFYGNAVKALANANIQDNGNVSEFQSRMARTVYFHAAELVRRGIKLPALSQLDVAGITNTEMLASLLKQKLITRAMIAKAYGAENLGSWVERQTPSGSRVRRINVTEAHNSVTKAFALRAEHGSEGAPPGGTSNQYEDCRATLCPDAGPDDSCPDCDDLEGKSRIQMRANSAVVIKSNTGGIRARLDGNPVRYNTLGQRIR